MIHLGTSFSGIGAVEMACKKIGVNYKIEFAGDVDPFCKMTYFANYEITEDKWHNDVRLFSAKSFKHKIDLYVGGSPCQSFSVMGKRKGLEEARGTLFYEYARIIQECQPKVFVFENVTGMLNHDNGKTWAIISNVFNSLEYYWTYWVLNAKDYGLPQNRRRIFVVGFRKDYAHNFEKLEGPQKIVLKTSIIDYLDSEIPNKYYLPLKGFQRVTSPNESKHVSLNGKIARCQVACQQYNWFGDMRFETEIPKRLEEDNRVYKGIYHGIRGVARTLTPRECLRLMGFPNDFNIVVDDTHMYKQSGNSIAVNVLEKVLAQIINTKIFDEQ